MPAAPLFSRILTVGTLPPAFAEALPLPVPADMLDPLGRLRLDRLIPFAAGAQPQTGPLLILTSRDLAMPGCESLFGYADRKHNIAVVSTFRLRAVSPEKLTHRVENEIAHEWGHLQGLEHCKRTDCVMRPVTDPAEIDTRPIAACGACPHKSLFQPSAAIAAILFLAGLAAGVNYFARPFLGAEFNAPFT
jgi:hypothetical protein